jgi:hypothetical protein
MTWDTIHDAVERFVRAKAGTSIPDGIAQILDLAAATTPHADWARLRTIDASVEAARLNQWFDWSLAAKPPDGPLHGLFFNVCNPIRADGVVTTDLDLGGTRQSADEDADWLFKQVYRSPDHAHAPVLDALYEIAYGSHDFGDPASGALQNDAEYPVGLAYAVLAARAIVEGRTSRDVAGPGAVVSVAAGFGEGDIALVGNLTPTGFNPNPGPVWAI